MPNPSQTKIFLTYSHKDSAFAKRLYADLRSHGLDGFFDIHSLKGGDRIAEEISKGLKECDVYIPVLSFASLKSPWCREELYGAVTLSNELNRNGKPKIVSVLIEDCKDELPVPIMNRLYFNFSGRYEEGFKELIERGLGLGESEQLLPRLTLSDKRKSSSADLSDIFKLDTTKKKPVSPFEFPWKIAGADSLEKTPSTKPPALATIPPFDLKKFWTDLDKKPATADAVANAVATIASVKTEYNISRNTEMGMVIRVEFNISGFKGHKGRAVAYFFTEGGEALADTDGVNCTDDKKVSASADFSPGYDPAYYSALEIFLPYSQFHVPAGHNTLKYYVCIWDMESPTSLAQSQWVSFYYDRPQVVLDKIWIDYDVTQTEKKGMNIHLKFEIVGYKDKKCSAVAYFYYADGTPLKDEDKIFSTQDDMVCVSKVFTPQYHDAIFHDEILFIPYTQLHTKRGKSDLKFHVLIWDDTQTKKLCESEWISFWCQV
jgi:hypothetical protein